MKPPKQTSKRTPRYTDADLDEAIRVFAAGPFEPAPVEPNEPLDEAIRVFNDGPTDEAFQAACRAVATIPARPACRTSETYRTAYRAGQALEAVEPADTRRYYRTMRRFGLWSAPGCDPDPLLEATFQRLTANDEEPRHA